MIDVWDNLDMLALNNNNEWFIDVIQVLDRWMGWLGVWSRHNLMIWDGLIDVWIEKLFCYDFFRNNFRCNIYS